MAFNQDGSVNGIYGSRPDHVLEKSTFPTAMPAAYDKESLLKDEWIQTILMDEL